MSIRRTLVPLLAALALLAALVVPAAAQSLPVNAPIPGVGVELEVLTTQVQDPTGLAVTSTGRVIVAERTGRLKAWDQDGAVTELGRIPVGANQCDGCPGGLHGLLLAQDFDESGALYAYYSVASTKGQAPVPAKHPEAGGDTADEGLFRLSRFTLDGDVLDLASEEVLLENPAFWDECCHYGGDLEWLPDGTIVLSTGDDTNPHSSGGFSPRDAQEGRDAWNAERTSQNPADRRGKILRLNPDGTVPDGSVEGVEANPFVGDDAYDPYVYALGFRSPYRITVHESGSLYVGNVGPDAFFASDTRGPAGYDEVEIVPAGGGTNHGWPRCIGDNEPYLDYDFETGESGEPLSCEGMTPAAFHYPYLASTDFPTLAAGLRSAMVGPVYDHDGDGALALPGPLFSGRLLFSEWMRNTLYTLPTAADGDLDTLQLLPFHAGTLRAIDMEIGPDGAVYLLEYGRLFYNNPDSQLSRLKCLACQPDPADYDGAAVRTVVDPALPTSDGSGRSLPTGLLAMGLVVVGLGVPLGRRLI
jgi:aldose sugar dehydrogenase